MTHVKLEIPYQADRERIIVALANSGYKVWVEEKKTYYLYRTTHEVNFDTIRKADKK